MASTRQKPTTKNPWKVLMVIFEGFNTLDVNGPLEVLCNFALRDESTMANPFEIYIATKSSTPIMTAFEFIKVHTCLTFEKATEMIHRGEIDVLITPGCPTSVAKNLINTDDPIFKPLRAFLESNNSSPSPHHSSSSSNNYQSGGGGGTPEPKRERWMISICIGALLNAYVGAFNNRPVTTHYAAIEDLQSVMKEYQPQATDTTFEKKRWVDGGSYVTTTTTHEGKGKGETIRIVSAGGISCGMDCMIWFITQVLGMKTAIAVANTMDYQWNGGAAGFIAPVTSQ